MSLCQLLIFTFSSTDVVLNTFTQSPATFLEEIVLKGLGLEEWCYLLTCSSECPHHQLYAAFGPAFAGGSASLIWSNFWAAISGFGGIESKPFHGEYSSAWQHSLSSHLSEHFENPAKHVLHTPLPAWGCHRSAPHWSLDPHTMIGHSVVIVLSTKCQQENPCTCEAASCQNLQTPEFPATASGPSSPTLEKRIPV